MSQNTYISNDEPLKSYTDLNYIHLSKHETIWKNIVDSHPFNQALTVFLPTCSVNLATEHFGQQIGFYYQVEAPLRMLLDSNFYSTFIQSDQYQLMMHSIDTDLNTDNVIVLDSAGNLSLSLTKDTYEKFGIQVQHRSKASMKHNKYIVNISLKDKHFYPESNQFNRLKWCLENTLTETFKFVFAAVDKSVTGITVDIQWPTQVTRVTKIDIEPQFETLTDVQIPDFENINHSIDSQPKENWDKHVLDAVEWIGLAYMKSNRIKITTKAVDPFVSVYKAPSTLLSSQTGTLIKWKGFIPATCIQNIMMNVRKLMTSAIVNEWTSVSVWGYRDSPYTWNKKEHYSYLNSENDYTFLLLPKRQTAYTIQFYGSHHSNV
ncbi:hypothetical protein G6F37_005268 [Rhizopus arrhizus]|nr:hypothetical protein G6F38_005474 [Rhizopus arrhizus]KAG1159022.1 hypothetical protein G6F37_005268 [Rhizopus arrhizus]